MRAAHHFPEIDDVADEIIGVGLDRLEEIKERARLRSPRAEVDIRDEDGANVYCALTLDGSVWADPLHSGGRRRVALQRDDASLKSECSECTGRTEHQVTTRNFEHGRLLF